MFDTEKIQRMTALLEKLPEEFDDVYLIPEKTFFQETAAIFRRLKIPIRAIIHDTIIEKEAWGIPVVKTAQVVENFNERTILILLTEKPVPFVQTTFNFRNRGGVNCSRARYDQRRSFRDLRSFDDTKVYANLR